MARVADMIAYVNHDIDDAVRAGLLHTTDLPVEALAVLGRSSSERIGTLVSDIVGRTLDTRPEVELRMSDGVLSALLDLRAFLFDAVYENRVAMSEFNRQLLWFGGWRQED